MSRTKKARLRAMATAAGLSRKALKAWAAARHATAGG